MKNYFPKESLLFLSIILSIIFVYQTSGAKSQRESDKEMQILLLFFKEEDLVITPTRYPKAISKVAENITVITSEELEMINAHTLTDALISIPGVQMDIKGGPGSGTHAHIQGSEYNHVIVMIDGVAMNNLSENHADIGAIPVQNIERVEIIKGPASSSWGSSLGGIIHIITKSPSDSEEITGISSGSYGEKNSTDYRVEASGTIASLGYYFYNGNLYSDGLTEGTPYDTDNFYTKLSWDIRDRGNLLFSLGFTEGTRGNLIDEDPYTGLKYQEEDTFEYLFSTLTLQYSINHEAKFKLSLRSASKEIDRVTYQLETGKETPRFNIDDLSYGSSIDLTWRHGIHNIVLGYDVDKGKLKSANIIGGKQYLKKWAIFSNDTIMINRFSLTPGIRYDYTNTNGDYVSPSFGLTYRITERNLFRGYIARGFHIPPFGKTVGKNEFISPNPDLEVEKVWSIQAGIESTALKYIWFKTTLFQHNIWDILDTEELLDPNGEGTGIFTHINKRKQRRQGIELEIKTVPVYNTSLFAGFSFIDAKDKNTGEKLMDVPKHTYDIGIHYYNNNKSFWVYLKGHYICWNAASYWNCLDRNFIWDINLMKNLHCDWNITCRTFLTIHNIFNGPQYLFYLYKNPKRWIEGGLKFKF